MAGFILRYVSFKYIIKPHTKAAKSLLDQARLHLKDHTQAQKFLVQVLGKLRSLQQIPIALSQNEQKRRMELVSQLELDRSEIAKLGMPI